MQILIIILCVIILVQWVRGEDVGRRRRWSAHKSSRRDKEQIERLKSRVAVLEQILLDRDRQLRDGFKGL